MFCSVNVGDPRGAVERHLKRVETSYAGLLEYYRIPGVPAIYVLDRQNVGRFITFGPVRKTEREKMIAAVL